jgi:hypothetical protein
VALLAALVMWRLVIIASANVKFTFLTLFLFAIGYSIGSLKILFVRQHEARSKKM